MKYARIWPRVGESRTLDADPLPPLRRRLREATSTSGVKDARAGQRLVAGCLLDFASCARDRLSVRDVRRVARGVAARVADAAAGCCLGGAGKRPTQTGFSRW